jgi:FtsZ-binding cell division protein ZapB
LIDDLLKTKEKYCHKIEEENIWLKKENEGLREENEGLKNEVQVFRQRLKN